MSGYHLYAFRIGHTSYLDIDDDWPDDSVDPASVLLGDLVGPGDKFTFEHDFGDGGPWGYADLLEAIADPEHERHAELLEWTVKASTPRPSTRPRSTGSSPPSSTCRADLCAPGHLRGWVSS
ncbi:MAG: IS1096 element passenger TnpR family protein [Actinomycetes bacterium]